MERAWVEVDVAAVQRNLSAIRRRIGARPDIIAVVKANAYGHGALTIARALSGAVQGFAVATPREALELREAGIGAPLLLLGPIPDEGFAALSDARITPLLLDRASAEAYARLARSRSAERPLSAHLKVDTGMARYGVSPAEAPEVLSLLARAGVEVEALATHFASAEDPQVTAAQERRFTRLRARLSRLGLCPPKAHLANSAGCLLRDARGDDAVRPGIALYGLDPGGRFAASGLSLEPALSVHARLAALRELPAGAPVGYGGTAVTRRPTRLGLVSIGYGDGWPYRESNRGAALVSGRRCPILGTVMMDGLAVDLTDLPRAPERGAEVVLLGRQGRAEIAASELAERLGTLVYELPCQLGARLPRRERNAQPQTQDCPQVAA